MYAAQERCHSLLAGWLAWMYLNVSHTLSAPAPIQRIFISYIHLAFPRATSFFISFSFSSRFERENGSIVTAYESSGRTASDGRRIGVELWKR